MADPQPTEVCQHFEETVNSKTPAEARRPVAALYMRVSTKGHSQTTETQAVALREHAQRRGYAILEYADTGVSGAKDRRPALDKLMRDARSGKFQIVMCARFDR